MEPLRVLPEGTKHSMKVSVRPMYYNERRSGGREPCQSSTRREEEEGYHEGGYKLIISPRDANPTEMTISQVSG